MTECRVVGPFRVSRSPKDVKFRIADEDRAKAEPYLAEYGCYIYVSARWKQLTPIYVGMTGSHLGVEAFAPHKQAKLAKHVQDRRDRLALFLIVPVSPAKPATKQVAEMEAYLIREAEAINAKVLNDRKLHRPRWSINGVTCDRGRGRPKREDGTTEFLRMMFG